MTPVYVFALPHNYRGPLYEDDLDEDGQPFRYRAQTSRYLDLPIPMPRSVMVTYGKGGPEDILAIDIHGERGGRIRKQDLQQVWFGICQYNRDFIVRGQAAP